MTSQTHGRHRNIKGALIDLKFVKMYIGYCKIYDLYEKIELNVFRNIVVF